MKDLKSAFFGACKANLLNSAIAPSFKAGAPFPKSPTEASFITQQQQIQIPGAVHSRNACLHSTIYSNAALPRNTMKKVPVGSCSHSSRATQNSSSYRKGKGAAVVHCVRAACG